MKLQGDMTNAPDNQQVQIQNILAVMPSLISFIILFSLQALDCLSYIARGAMMNGSVLLYDGTFKCENGKTALKIHCNLKPGSAPNLLQ